MLDPSKTKEIIYQKVLKAVTAIGNMVEGEQKRSAPVDTGFLRDNIVHTVDIESDEITLTFSSNAPYSGYVEHGTSRMNAQPFFYPPLIGLDRKLKEKINE